MTYGTAQAYFTEGSESKYSYIIKLLIYAEKNS